MSVLQDVLSKFPIWRSFFLIFQSFCKIGELRTIMLLAFGVCSPVSLINTNRLHLLLTHPYSAKVQLLCWVETALTGRKGYMDRK